jgi:SAM-dependent methyltransferase
VTAPARETGTVPRTRPTRLIRRAAAALLGPAERRPEARLAPDTTFYDTAATRSFVDYLTRRFPEQPQASYFQTHAGRFAFLCELIHRLKVVGPALDAGGLPQTRELFVEKTSLPSVDLTPDVDLEIDSWADAVGPARYGLAIFSEVIEHFNADPARALHELNRCLTPGGHLVLTTVNIASELGLYNLARGYAPYAMSNLYGSRVDRHQREYAPTELQVLVAAHGFETWTTTVNLYADAPVKRDAHAWCEARDLNPRLHGDTVVVVARKVDESPGARWLHPIYHSSVAVNAPNTVPADVAERVRHGAPPGLDALF